VLVLDDEEDEEPSEISITGSTQSVVLSQVVDSPSSQLSTGKPNAKEQDYKFGMTNLGDLAYRQSPRDGVQDTEEPTTFRQHFRDKNYIACPCCKEQRQ